MSHQKTRYTMCRYSGPLCNDTMLALTPKSCHSYLKYPDVTLQTASALFELCDLHLQEAPKGGQLGNPGCRGLSCIQTTAFHGMLVASASTGCTAYSACTPPAMTDGCVPCHLTCREPWLKRNLGSIPEIRKCFQIEFSSSSLSQSSLRLSKSNEPGPKPLMLR